MKRFWEHSPLYQRKHELQAELEKAKAARDEAGQRVLACVLLDAVAEGGAVWMKSRVAYQEAHEAWEAASDAWYVAFRAYKASPVGQAEARYWKDPLAFRAAESEAA